MRLQFPHKSGSVSSDHLLFPYWGSAAYVRPEVKLMLRGPDGGQWMERALLDTGATYTVFEEPAARQLGLTPPFSRTTSSRVVGGSEVSLTFPENDPITLFLSDYRTGFFAWRPLIGFSQPPANAPPKRRPTALLGHTGFFQFFDVAFRDEADTPIIDIAAKSSFPGRAGGWPPPQDWWTLPR